MVVVKFYPYIRLKLSKRASNPHLSTILYIVKSNSFV